MAYKSADKPSQEKEALEKTEEDIAGYEAPHGHPMHGITIVGEEKSGKNETRLFQTDVGVKVWMTKEEAEKAGKYWAPSEDPKKDPTQKQK